MNSAPASTPWIALSRLRFRFDTNIAALTTRYPDLAAALRSLAPRADYFIQTAGQSLILGSAPIGTAAITALKTVVSPAAATATLAGICPGQKCTEPLLVAGEDLGWLWNQLYQLPCEFPQAQGHRPPLYFLIADLERLWVILHIQDWPALLADHRVRLFAGTDCTAQLSTALANDIFCPWPVLSVDIDPALLPAGRTLTQLMIEARLKQSDRLEMLKQKQVERGRGITPESVARRLAAGQPLRVLGITSRYTTFIQHSMRDWLDAFSRLGHTARLLIEPADHTIANNLAMAIACDEFAPDLVVAIDHFRDTLIGVPDQVPVLMWVQDSLPKLFSTAAGKLQKELDFAMGIAPIKMIHEFGYPAQRYMPALIGVNDRRFTPNRPIQPKYACDISFISHASTPARVLLDQVLVANHSPHAHRLTNLVFDRLQAVYDTGAMVTEPITIQRIIERTFADTQTSTPADQMPVLMDLFVNKINNAMFRHQPLIWLSQAGVNLRLYGRGWEKHPQLARHAFGPIDNQTQLADVYAAARINLQISPHGAVHQRVMEGLCSGGFFMLRHCPGDVMERHFKPILDFCRARQLTNDTQLRQHATPEIQQRIDQVETALQRSPFAEPWTFFDALLSSEQSGYIRSAGCIWGDDYDAVAFDSQAQLLHKIDLFLRDESLRKGIAESMRKAVQDRFTYVATTRAALEFLRQGLCPASGRAAA